MSKTTKRTTGAVGFADEYWQVNYASPEEMDGIGNVQSHVGYIKNLFGLEFIDVSSVIDFGFGLGHLFEGVLKEFIPFKAVGVEPSEFAFNEVKKRDINPVESTKLQLYNTDIISFCRKYPSLKRFDLGICTSVFQYLNDDEIEEALAFMALKCKYVYFSVPTDIELKRQVEELEFFDEYAIRRSRSKYQKMIKKHFTFVSSRVLESKIHFDEETTSFTDLLFRF
ncbi:hypothetical protein M899_2379 [Bacteriovorax sp. BSW11_IV]|uniref:class I SAM-dependent methyltransferase n=1 Tax=Bacteriovorax sp. BSW11_IV TaxID=1353529 RepID=UPI00038A2136|nr:class I SAM-dependent methyltransferase [Bacteriovorax sp. BSW11_IV]EQC44484.1 hypothetical protein M899_2379 [Bacteriovorax sp. BSW11_IV]